MYKIVQTQYEHHQKKINTTKSALCVFVSDIGETRKKVHSTRKTTKVSTLTENKTTRIERHEHKKEYVV